MQWIQGFQVGRNPATSITVSHLLFADDTLIFCGAVRSQVTNLSLTLLIFEAISGLHINMQKSVIYPVNVVTNLEDLASILCCSVGSFPTTYLGLPLGAKYKSVGSWNGIIEKFERRLATWQQQYLSMGGRLTLINSVLDSLPTYFMSLFPMPSSVLKQLDRFRRRFLWEGNSTSHKFSLVKWQKVTQPKAQGGLGIRDLKSHNKSMLMKWLWRYGQAETGLWKDIIVAKHGAHNHWRTKRNMAPHGVGLWKHISTYWDDFFENVTFKAGNGAHIKFWKDKWLGDYPLMITYPALAQVTCNLDSTIAQNRIDNTWTPQFRRSLHDWEISDLLLLLSSLENYKMNDQLPDSLSWGNSKERNYTVSSCYNLLCSHNGMLDNWPWKIVWRTRLPLKVSCFTWTTLNEACLTQDNLCKRKIVLVNRCYMCQNNSESISHLFLHCPVAADIWCLFQSIFGISWVMPQSIKEAYESWCFLRVDKAIKTIWRMIPPTIFWCIWIERNRRCFDGNSTPLHSLKTKCLISLFSWYHLTPVNSSDELFDFVSSLVLL